MATTYDPTLPTTKDWVRLLIGDTDTSDAALTDEEIAAIITEETKSKSSATKYCAAARAGEIAFARWQMKGGGVVEKAVDGLRIERGDGEEAGKAYRDYLKELRAKCAEELTPNPAAFKVFDIVS